MGWFKLSSSDDVMLDTQQKDIIMTTQQTHNKKSQQGSNSNTSSLFGTNKLRNRYSVSARIRHGPVTAKSMLSSSPSASSSYLLLLLVAFAYIACTFADPLSQDPDVKCNDSQFRCDCGVPRCIDMSLVKNGEKDCQDGSDEGQWDPSKCAIKNTTSEDIRFKRAALPENPPRVLSNGDATTQYFNGDRARTRPVGLLSTNLGAFVTSGTTTEYLTKILGTYIKGTYARIISTSSKVYHAVPTDGADFATGSVRPTGFIASTVSTEVNGYATTQHTTDYYRTYIDGTYAQLVSSYSHVQYPSWYHEQIDPTVAAELASSEIYATKASNFHVSVSSSSSAGPNVLPHEVRGSFVNSGLQSKAVAELGVVVSSSSSSSDGRDSNRLRALRPNNAENELRVTGTHGKFVHTGKQPGEETTYNVFTGSYVQNAKTFLFFFGNTVIDPSKSGEQLSQTLMVENGTSKSLLVDMSKNLRVIVPSKNNRLMVDGSVNGEHMEGVIVEIEGSEQGIPDDDDAITVGGANAKSTPSDPRIDMITVNLNKKGKTSVSTSSSSSSSKSRGENENEIPRARKVPGDSSVAANLIRPSRTRTVSLPTFTVGQPDIEDAPLDNEPATSTASSSKVVVNVESSSTKSRARAGAPVFQKPTTERIQRTTERIQSYSKNSANSYTPTYKNAANKMPNRSHRAFAGFDMAMKFNDIDSDLQSAASTGRATVTYVGFADFTTTVGNTVIVFMPRTKMIEDLNVHVSATTVLLPSSKIQPTRFVYQTDEETTTQRRPSDDDEISVSRPKGRKVGVSASVSVSSSTTTPRSEDDEETTTEISPSEAVREVSGRQTLILGNKKSSSSSGNRFSSEFLPKATPALRPSLASKFRPSLSSSQSSSQDRRNSLFSNSHRPRYTPKSKTSEAVSSSPVVTKPTSQSGVYQVASTAVFQTDVVNPTGLVTSIDGTIIRDKTTYLFTSLVYGTFIGSSYAQIIKSTSRLLPVKATQSAGPTVIRPTPIARFPRPSKSRGFFNDETTTTETPTTEQYDEEVTTIRPLDRMEVSVSSTTERGISQENDDTPTTTVRSKDIDDDSYYDDYTTTERDIIEKENEIERRRKVAGNAKDQIIVDKDNDIRLEATPTPSISDEEQTIYVTRTQPTTVYRTYTYYTTYFIPKEDSTLTSVTSREVTSTSTGLVRKTYSSIRPSATEDSAAEVTETVSNEEKSRGKYKPSARGKVRPSGAQVIYKTFYTTFTYLTTFFTGQTSSIKSREEIISNVVTLTSSIGSTSTTLVKIRPTSSAVLRSRAYKTVSPRPSSIASQGGSSNVGSSSPGLNRYSSIRKNARLSSKIVSVPPSPSAEIKSASRAPSKIMEPVTVLKTFYTTYTYFTTLFNGDETSIKSRTEVLTNVVPTVTRTAIVPTASVNPTDPSDEYSEEYDEEDTERPDTAEEKDKFATSTAFRMSNKNKQKETTFYTTYTYLTTSLGQDGDSQIRSSLKTFTNVLVGDKTIRSGMVGIIEPTKLTGRSAGRGSAKKTARPFSSSDDDDLNELGSHVSETSETTQRNEDEEATTIDPHHNDYYELEGSETPITTDRSIFDEELDRKKSSGNKKNKKQNSKNVEDEEDGLEPTPILKTFFTTFTYYTTYYQDGASTVSSRLETKTQVVSDTAIGDDDDVEPTASATEALLSTPVEPVTYYTTFTYWTTSSIDGSTIVNSREETVTNVVTPEAEEAGRIRTIFPSGKALKASENEILPSATNSELELTTFFTTFTYYTTSYIGDSTVVNSRLETVTNVVTGTEAPVSPTKASPRAIGTQSVSAQGLGSSDKDEYQDYDLQTGLLSTIVSSEVVDRTTTIYSTDVFGTYIDGIYAQVLESTSSVINPTAAAETRFLPEATETSTGVVSVNEGKTVDANGLHTTYYGTTAYGTVIDGTYAHLIETSSSVKNKPGATEELDATEEQKTGLVRIIDGTLVDGDHTTFYTSSILGTFIGGQYAQVIESTSRYVISPTKTDGISTVRPTKNVDLEGSITERPDEEEGTTTEKTNEQEEEEQPEFKRPGVLPGRRPSFGRNRNSSRLSYKSSSKSATPSITPFASRSRPSGFTPRGRKTSAVISPTKSSESTSGGSPSTSSRGGFQSRRRFQKPSEESSSNSPSSSSDTTTATPRLPFSRGTSRFQRPTSAGGSRFASSKSEIQPTSASSSSSSSPGGRQRSSFNPRGSSVSGARGRGSSASSTGRSTSSAGFRGGSSSSSRFLPGRGRPSASINPSSTSATTVKPTQTSALNADEEEYEVEYEYESQQPSTSTTTTENPRTTNNRFSGGSRFRLNPRLSTPASTSGTTSRPTTTRNLPFLRRQSFSKPTLPTRGTTPTSASTPEGSSTASTGEDADGEYEEIEVIEYEEDEKPSSSTTTTRPGRPGLLGRRPGAGGLSSLTSRPSSRAPQQATTRARSTTETPQATRGTTTRKTYTPRPRPAGFPKPIGVTRSTTTTTEKPDSTLEEYYEDGDFEYEESKHYPANITIDQISAGSVPVETVVEADQEVAGTAPAAAVEIPSGAGASGSDGSQLSAVAPAQDSIDTVDALLSYAAGSPYAESVPGQQEVKSTRRRRKRSNNARQVYDYYGSYNPYLYNYNQQQFGARTARGTLRSNFPSSSNTRRSGSSSSSNSNYGSSNSRGGPTYVSSDYEYVDYYDEPSPPPTTAAPARTAPSSRLRGRIQPTPTSHRRTPFTLTHTDNSATNNNNQNSNTNTRASPTTRSRTSLQTYSRTTSRPTSSNSNTNSRTFIPRRSQSRYNRPTEPPTTTSRSNRFRSRYNPRESVTTAAPSFTRSRFGSQLTRGRGAITSNPIGSRHNIIDTPAFEPSATLTVTHYIPEETSIPFVNGKSTEYKTVLTPSPSVEILAPFQYTLIDYQGKPVFVKNDEVTSTVSPGVTEITQFLLRESTTSTVTFTPTTIRGRKTSFSHILPSTVYSVEPVVSTISNPNPLAPLLNQNNPNDPNQLTNLLLNQLLGLNPNLLGLQGNPLLMANLLNPNNQLNPEPATPVTHYSTITTSYTTTVTDFTSTVIPITLHGKAIKTTIVESSTKVISAVEYITSSTVITPSPLPQLQATQQPPQAALLQNLLQSQLLQQQLLQQQQQLQPIVPTTPPQLLLPQVQPTQQVALLQQLQQLQQQQQQNIQQVTQQPQPPQQLQQEQNKQDNKISNNKNEQQEQVKVENDKKEEQKPQPKIEVTTAPPVVQASKSDDVPAGSHVVTVYVSGKKPGEFSTVLQTVPIDGSRKRRSVSPHFTAEAIEPTQAIVFGATAGPSLSSSVALDSSSDVVEISSGDPTVEDRLTGQVHQDKLRNTNVEIKDSNLDSGNIKPVYVEPSDILFATSNDENSVDVSGSKRQRGNEIILEDSYSYSDSFSNLMNTRGNSGGSATESLDSVIGDFSHFDSRSASVSLFASRS